MNHRLEQIEDLRATLEMRRDRPNSLDGPPTTRDSMNTQYRQLRRFRLISEISQGMIHMKS